MAVQPYNYANTLSNIESIKGQRNANALAEQRYATNEQANQLQQQQLSEEQKQKFATVMVHAAQYGLQSSTPKAFIEQNYPQLVELAGPQWQQLDDTGVKQKLTEAIGHFGPAAGVGPAQPKERGLINTVDENGNPVRGEDVPGARVYTPPEKPQPRFRAMSPQEVKTYGLPDGSAAQINDTTGQIQVLNNPAASGAAAARGTFKNVQALRKEFDNLPEVKNYKLVLPLFNRAANAPATRAGDLSIIYALGKMFDPGSVVREGELVMAGNTAPWLTNLVSKANSQLTGDGALSKETRVAIIEALKGQMDSLRQPYDQERQRFSGYADENGWEPSSVVGKATPSEAFGGGLGGPGGPGGAPAPAASVPTATGPGGQKLYLRNGQWVPQ